MATRRTNSHSSTTLRRRNKVYAVVARTATRWRSSFGVGVVAAGLRDEGPAGGGEVAHGRERVRDGRGGLCGQSGRRPQRPLRPWSPLEALITEKAAVLWLKIATPRSGACVNILRTASTSLWRLVGTLTGASTSLWSLVGMFTGTSTSLWSIVGTFTGAATSLWSLVGTFTGASTSWVLLGRIFKIAILSWVMLSRMSGMTPTKSEQPCGILAPVFNMEIVFRLSCAANVECLR